MDETTLLHFLKVIDKLAPISVRIIHADRRLSKTDKEFIENISEKRGFKLNAKTRHCREDETREEREISWLAHELRNKPIFNNSDVFHIQEEFGNLPWHRINDSKTCIVNRGGHNLPDYQEYFMIFRSNQYVADMWMIPPELNNYIHGKELSAVNGFKKELQGLIKVW